MIISATEHSKSMTTYLKEGLTIASRINNKGPLVLDENGKLHPKILKAYEKYGFYIFENVFPSKHLPKSSPQTSPKTSQMPPKISSIPSKIA